MTPTNSDFDAHVETYHGFVRALRYVIAAAAIILLLMTAFLL